MASFLFVMASFLFVVASFLFVVASLLFVMASFLLLLLTGYRLLFHYSHDRLCYHFYDSSCACYYWPTDLTKVRFDLIG